MVEDSQSLPLEEYLYKYYSKYENDSLKFNYWNKTMKESIDPCYNEELRDETLKKKWKFTDVKFFKLDKMNFIYAELASQGYFPDDINRFIGVMAGLGFFDSITLSSWLNSKNWSNNINIEEGTWYSLLEIAKVKYGDNLIRSNLTILKWWNTFR